jgi:hypothetical protein
LRSVVITQASLAISVCLRAFVLLEEVRPAGLRGAERIPGSQNLAGAISLWE